MKKRVQAILPIKRMVVFGSRARGDAIPESDMDVFIEVTSITPEQRRQISEAAWEVGLEWEVVITTFVGLSQQIEHGILRASPILTAIEKEGIAV